MSVLLVLLAVLGRVLSKNIIINLDSNKKIFNNFNIKRKYNVKLVISSKPYLLYFFAKTLFKLFGKESENSINYIKILKMRCLLLQEY